MKRVFYYFLIFLLFYFCFIFDGSKELPYKVIDVMSSSKICVDFNNDGKKDKNEIVYIRGIKELPFENSKKAKEYAKRLNLKESEIVKLGKTSNNIARKSLLNTYVKIKKNEIDKYDADKKIRFAKISLKGGEDYAEVFLRSGLAMAAEADEGLKSYKKFENKELIIENAKNNKESLLVHDKTVLSKISDASCTKKFLNQINHKNLSYPKSFQKGKITLYLNNPHDYPKPSYKAESPVCRNILNDINNAQSSIDFAIYGIDGQEEFVQALLGAANRNVNVRGVSDSNEYGKASYRDIEKLAGNLPITYDKSKSHMHNKFFIIDDKILYTGSMNVSKTGCGGYNSNSVAVIKDDRIIAAYKKEFEQMYKGIFGQNKINNSTPFYELDKNTLVSAKFTPKGNIYYDVIRKEIKAAESKIRVSAFVLTHNSIVSDLVDAKNRGVDVSVILDAVGASRYKWTLSELRKNEIKTRVENWGGKNHEKTISIDDKTLIMGSANLSFNAYLNNDENILIIKDKEITKFYNGFFDVLFSSIDQRWENEVPLAESFDSKGSCFDGIDNNFDGLKDGEDLGCKN